MASAHINRGILAIFMESPVYFTIPLRERLEFLNSFSQQSTYNRTCECDEYLISGKSYSKEPPFIKP